MSNLEKESRHTPLCEGWGSDDDCIKCQMFDCNNNRNSTTTVTISKEEYLSLLEAQRQLGCYIEDQIIWLTRVDSLEKSTKTEIIRVVEEIKFYLEERSGSSLEDTSVEGETILEVLREVSNRSGVNKNGR